jgi:hypothetical protein
MVILNIHLNTNQIGIHHGKDFIFMKGLVNGVAVLSSNDGIHPVRWSGEETRNIEIAKQVIDIFLKNPVVKEKIEYIKYP